MRNRIIFCLLTLIVFINIIKPFSVSADALLMDPTSIAGLADMGYGLFGGASFDFTGSKYVLDAADLNQANAEDKAWEFLQDYCISRGINYPVYGQPTIVSADPLSTSNIFNNYIFQSYHNYKKATTSLEQQEALKFYISPQMYSDWTNYNLTWYKQYASQFADASDQEVATPSERYLNQVNNIINFTSDGAEIYNLPFRPESGPVFGFLSQSASYYSPDAGTGSWITGANIYSIYPTTLNVNSNTLTVDLSWTPIQNYFTSSGNFSHFNILWQYISRYNQGYGSTTTDNIDPGNPLLNMTFDNMDNLMNYLQNHFKRCAIRVDGVLWGDPFVNNVIYNPVIPDITDVIDKDTDDPSYDIVFPDTPDNSGYFDLTSILNKITNAIIGASDTDDSTSGTLEGTGDIAITDTDGTTVYTDTRDAYDVIVVDGPAIDPNLPVIPLPPDIKDAFNGTSILAELIDGTQQVLPDELITVFWGIVCTIFIIGLIRVMHK